MTAKFPVLPRQDSLPFPATPSASTPGRTMQDSTYQPRVQEPRLPADAPNILVVLIDDAGPGLPSTFGGEVRTDTLTRLRDEGIGYNRFHTTAMCSPTRASLLTGRNHHRIGNGRIDRSELRRAVFARLQLLRAREQQLALCQHFATPAGVDHRGRGGLVNNGRPLNREVEAAS